jgi:quinol-cytochrome oxidoreductase complex cytochrome b subunit
MKADPFAPAYEGIRPEWYFLFVFQTLKLIPGGSIAGIEYEAIPLMLFGALALLVLLVPFLDRGAARTGRSPAFTIAGVVILMYCVAMTSLGQSSMTPVWIALATTTLLAGWIALERRRQGREKV